MEELTFRHSLPIQLRFNDVDKFGHVNNSVYFSYYDLGKAEYFATVRPDLDWEKEGIVVVHLEVDFLAQIFATDPIAVETTVAEIGTKSMKLIQRVVDNKGEVKCVCQSILVAFNLEKHESQEISEEWIQSISAYERRDVRKKKA
ncbi:MAG: acyl-CoA thioesterase [Bacteroides sp.]|nr:acyl-CoA thioesterase [Bacteroides sp.]